MKLLHTADWHVGKMLKGRSRADEHAAVLAEIVEIASSHEVEVVLVAGDLYETATPSAESEQIVYTTLLALAQVAEHVIVIAGNHDNPRRFSAVQPLLELTHVHARPIICKPDDGGVLKLSTRAGEKLQIALLPFVSQRGIVRADDLMDADADQHNMAFADKLSKVVGALCADAADDAVNVLMGHAMVHGGVMGGGERSAHTIFEYSIPTTAFPGNLHYVALGHLHRCQSLPAACPVYYSGSPLQLDFGEEQDAKSVNVIEAVAGKPAKVDTIALTSGRRLITLRGDFASLARQAEQHQDHFLRIELDEAPRYGLSDEVRELYPNALDVRLIQTTEVQPAAPSARDNKSPIELFEDYLASRSAADGEEVTELFKEILEAHYEAATH